MARLPILALIAWGVFLATAAAARDPLVTRSPSGPQNYDVFENDQRIGTIRPDAGGKPSLEGVSPLERGRYTFERSPSAPSGYEVLRDGKRIGTVIMAPLPRPAPLQIPRPGADRLDLPGSGGGALELDRPGPALDRR